MPITFPFATRALLALICILAIGFAASTTPASAQEQDPDDSQELQWLPEWGTPDDEADEDAIGPADAWGDEEGDEDIADEVLGTPVQIPLATTKTVAGTQAMLRADGRAAIPRNAPARVRAIITAANRIVGKPYKWGGGHASVADRGYDCSGAVSFPLIKTKLLAAPLVSGAFARWGVKGAGRWVTIYANKGHVYMEVAGLRLDTSAAGDTISGKGVHWRPVTGKRAGFKLRHPRGL